MSASLPVVVDTNILFSALIRGESRFSEILLKSGREFYVCELAIVELFRHKEKLVLRSRLSEDEIGQVFHLLLRKLNLYKEDLIPVAHIRTAHALCSEVDPNDMPHVALTLALDAVLWTGDLRLRRGLEARGFTRFFNPSL